MIYWCLVFSGTRARLPGEITSVTAEQSHTVIDRYAAQHAIDLDWDTYSITAPDQDRKTWFRLTLDKVHCITQVFWNWSGASTIQPWTCSDTYCNCKESYPSYCSLYSVKITTKGQGKPQESLPHVSDCEYGDTVQISKAREGGTFSINEIAVVGKQGKRTVSKE